jgi:response regulator RpfG family c-di-GMP phosphodiesterase
MANKTTGMTGNGRTILIVDDDIDFQFMITTMLKLSGFDVKSLLEGQLMPVVDAAKVCDLVLLDIELPGTKGVDIAIKLKSLPETASIPIILCSGHDECEPLFLASKANAVFKKPFSLRQLLSKIEELLEFDIVELMRNQTSMNKQSLTSTGKR